MFRSNGEDSYRKDSRIRKINAVTSASNVIVFIGAQGVENFFQGTRFVASLPSDTLRLGAPIPLTLYKCGMSYFAYSQDVDLYGMGDSVEQSIDDIKSMLVELWYDLHSEIDRLGPIPRRQLAALSQLIHEA